MELVRRRFAGRACGGSRPVIDASVDPTGVTLAHRAPPWREVPDASAPGPRTSQRDDSVANYLPARAFVTRRVWRPVAARFAVFAADLRFVPALSTSNLARTVGTFVRTNVDAALASETQPDSPQQVFERFQKWLERNL